MLHCPTCDQEFAEEVRVCPEDGTPLQANSTVRVNIPVDPLIGRTLDEKYRLEERIGTGGMGTVYRAAHLLIDRPVAVKVLNPRFVEDEAAQTRFRREARAAGRIQHNNAVTVTDFGSTSDGLVYIVMELLEGHTLRDVLAREAPLDTARAVSLMLQTASAVAAAHEAGVIHRDLKPANIFIVQRKDAPPFVKVLDFGIAKLAADALDDDDPQTLTQVGVMIGTPRYMSPEQCDGAKLTPASDVYSLGIILYEMLTGTTPFTGTSPLAIALKHSSDPPRRPREFVAAIPPALEEVVMHALEKRPDNRPQNAEELRRELYDVVQKAGLEHAATFSAPTLETLRSAGTETPSGRLVIDIERLRERRAAASMQASAPAAPAAAAGSSLKQGSDGHSAPPALNSAPVEPSVFPLRPPAIGRIRIFFEQKESWFRWLTRPIRILLISMTALLLFAILLAVLATRSTAKLSLVSTDSAALGTLFIPAEGDTQGVAPNRGADNGRSGRRQQGTRNNEREARRVVRPVQPPKQESTIKRAVKKIRNIFKNPF